MNGARVRVLLPRVGDFDAMAEEAFVAGDVFGDRLDHVRLGGEIKREPQDKDKDSWRPTRPRRLSLHILSRRRAPTRKPHSTAGRHTCIGRLQT